MEWQNVANDKIADNGHRTLADLLPGQDGIVLRVQGDAALRHRLAAMGIVNGARISIEHTAPMGDPKAYRVLDYMLSMRNEEARHIILKSED